MWRVLRLDLISVSASNWKFLAAKESLFDVLKRSPWWLSLVIAIGIAASLQLVLPMSFALFSALPFVVIGGYSAWRQRGTPGEAQTARILEQVRTMNWQEFSALVAEAYRQQGCEVTVHGGGDADLELRKGSRITLLACEAAQKRIRREVACQAEARTDDHVAFRPRGPKPIHRLVNKTVDLIHFSPSLRVYDPLGSETLLF